MLEYFGSCRPSRHRCQDHRGPEPPVQLEGDGLDRGQEAGGGWRREEEEEGERR